MKIKIIVISVLLFLTSLAFADELLKKENLQNKIEAIKKNTPPNCFSHGEIDCSLGPDQDASVICKDGFKNAAMKYDEFCSEVKLEAQYLIQTDSKDTPFIKHGNKLISEIKNSKPLAFHLNLRNLSDIPAKNLTVEFTIARKYPYNATGPKTILPYALAEYTLLLTDIDRELTLQEIQKTVYKINCQNCSGIFTTR